MRGYRGMKRSAVWALSLCAAAMVAASGTWQARADEVDLPTRKTGLWDMKVRLTGGGIPTMSMQQCTDPATDQDLRTIYSPLAKENCDKRTVQKTAAGYAVDRVCKR